MAWWSKDTVAVVTGSNKGLGYAIVRALARHGVTTVVTARDPAQGRVAIDSAVKAEPELSGLLRFHQLDVTSANSVTEFASWLSQEFGGIDIFINNAGIQLFSEAYEDAVKTFAVNYYGAKRVTEAVFPLLRASPHGPRLLLISSMNGQLLNFEHSDYVKTKVKEAVDDLDKNKVDAIAAKYLDDVKGGHAKEGNWAKDFGQYRESKLFLNAYTRILAQEAINHLEGRQVCVNAMCPGVIDTDMVGGYTTKFGVTKEQLLTMSIKLQTTDEAAEAPVWLALLPKEELPHGKFYNKMEEKSW